MARKDALLRLHQRLMDKRTDLHKKLGGGPQWQSTPQRGGDVGDAANRGTSHELNTQLAALENRELRQVEQAIELIRNGRYGTCEQCNHSIPLERLRAVPTTIMCIKCQQKIELTGQMPGDTDVDWSNALAQEGQTNTSEVTLRDPDAG